MSSALLKRKKHLCVSKLPESMVVAATGGEKLAAASEMEVFGRENDPSAALRDPPSSCSSSSSSRCLFVLLLSDDGESFARGRLNEPLNTEELELVRLSN